MSSWGGRRAVDALRLVKAEGRRTGAPCVICGQPIDYRLAYPDPSSCSVQHVKSRKYYPHLTWDPNNHKPAHLSCNQSAGADGDQPLGITSNI